MRYVGRKKMKRLRIIREVVGRITRSVFSCASPQKRHETDLGDEGAGWAELEMSSMDFCRTIEIQNSVLHDLKIKAEKVNRDVHSRFQFGEVSDAGGTQVGP
jgi:hypothetical protein